MVFQNASDETLVMLTLAGEQTAYEVPVTRYRRADGIHAGQADPASGKGGIPIFG